MKPSNARNSTSFALIEYDLHEERHDAWSHLENVSHNHLQLLRQESTRVFDNSRANNLRELASDTTEVVFLVSSFRLLNFSRLNYPSRIFARILRQFMEVRHSLAEDSLSSFCEKGNTDCYRVSPNVFFFFFYRNEYFYRAVLHIFNFLFFPVFCIFFVITSHKGSH